MNITTEADVNDDVYYLDATTKVKKGSITKIVVEVTALIRITYTLKTKDGTLTDRGEISIGVTQDSLFDKIRLKEAV